MKVEGIQPRLMTNEERISMGFVLASLSAERNGKDRVLWSSIAELMFWRDAVKNADPYRIHRDHGSDWKECVFCGGGWGPEHNPDCVWLLAQEQK